MKKIGIILALAGTVLLSSCGGENSGEILDTFSELAPRAEQLYRVIYGDELPHAEIGEDGYGMITSDAAFESIDEIEAAMENVFYSDYCKILSNTAFLGVASDEGGISAKFIEKDGVLYVNPSVTEHFGEPREFDLSEAKVIKKNKYMAVILVPHPDGDVEVSMQKTEHGWRINSPLY